MKVCKANEFWELTLLPRMDDDRFVKLMIFWELTLQPGIEQATS
jgi:hypothetical protein